MGAVGVINAGAGALGAVGDFLGHFIASPAQTMQYDLANRQLDLQGKALDYQYQLQGQAIDTGRRELLYKISGQRQTATLFVIGLAVLTGGAVLTALAVKG